MKIITPGNKRWQFSVKNTCNNCGAVYVLEDGDKFYLQYSGKWVDSNCPCCAHDIRTFNPNFDFQSHRIQWVEGFVR